MIISESNPLLDELGVTKEQLFNVIEFLNKECLLLICGDITQGKKLIKIFENDVSKLRKIMQLDGSVYEAMPDSAKYDKKILEKLMQGGFIGDVLSDVINQNNFLERLQERFGYLLSNDKTIEYLLISAKHYELDLRPIIDIFQDRIVKNYKMLDSLLKDYYLDVVLDVWGEDYNIVKQVLKRKGNYLLYTKEEFKKDRELIRLAIHTYPFIVFDFEISPTDELYILAIDRIKELAKKELLFVDVEEIWKKDEESDT